MRSAVCFLLITFFFFGVVPGQQKKATDKDENKIDLSRQLNVVKEVKPVPADYKTGFDSIDGEDGMAILKFLASDALEGRDTGSNGHQVAAEFAATLFKCWGLKPGGDMPSKPRMRGFRTTTKKTVKPSRSYLQQVELKEYLDSSGNAKAEWRGGGVYKSLDFSQDVDYQYRSRKSGVLAAPVAFVGYGISEKKLKFDEYKGIDVKGKIVMMLTETPKKGVKDSPFESEEMKKKYATPQSRFSRSGSSKVKLAMKQGAVAVLLVENSPAENKSVAKKILENDVVNDERPIFPGKRRSLALIDNMKMPWDTIPTVRISRQMADQILELAGQKSIDELKQKIESSMKPGSMSLAGLSFTISQQVETKLVKTPNVVAYIEGSDPELKNEVIVLGGHLDHLGKRGDYIFNGADDNGSGSTLVIEVAQAFALNPVKPKRTVVFALWTGEEKGLLGSRYYVANPPFPLKKTVAYFNFDMVSRLWSKKRLKMMMDMMHMKLPEEELETLDVEKMITFSYPDSSPDLMELFTENNQYVGLSLFLRESKGLSMGGGGSDHMSFGTRKVPWISFFGAMTEDFHQPTDTQDRVSSELMQMTGRLAFLSAITLANK